MAELKKYPTCGTEFRARLSDDGTSIEFLLILPGLATQRTRFPVSDADRAAEWLQGRGLTRLEAMSLIRGYYFALVKRIEADQPAGEPSPAPSSNVG